MISFIIRVVRTKPKPRWAFWQRSVADVFARVPGDDVNEARALARADLEARGWRIEWFEHTRRVDADFPRDDAHVRRSIRRASTGTPVYDFHEPFHTAAPEDVEAIEIRSRYLDSPDSPDVVIDPSRVPEHLRPLLRFGGEWAMGDDVERSRFIKAVALEKKKEFVNAVSPHFEEIERYSRAHENDVPVPDEVVVLNMLAEAADTASHDITE